MGCASERVLPIAVSVFYSVRSPIVTASTPAYLRTTKDGLILEVVVAPRAKRSKFVGFHGGYPKIALAAPPIEGRANEELVSFLKRLPGIPGWDTSRRKGPLFPSVCTVVCSNPLGLQSEPRDGAEKLTSEHE